MKKVALVLVLVLGAAVVLGGVVLFMGAGLGARDRAATQAVCSPSEGLAPQAVEDDAEVAGYGSDQLTIAATIMRVADDLGLGAHGQTVAVMTAMGESSLINVAHGDPVRHDTIGIFQTGPEWGTYEQRMDPAGATALFVERLTSVDGWKNLRPTIAAHRAQRNADPLHYAESWDEAVKVVTALSGGSGMPADYDIGTVKPQTQMLADEIGSRFGLSDSDMGGYRENAVDSGGHPAGLAVDFMVGDDEALGDRIAEYLLKNADRLSVDYVIWQQAIWMSGSAADEWESMDDRGGPTANHMDHVHVNVKSEPSQEGGLGAAACLTSTATSPTSDGASDSGEWVRPSDAVTTSGYGPRWGGFHAGLDFGAACGTPIYAASGGVVTYTGEGHSRYGLTGYVIVVDHGGGLETTYNHMFATGIQVRPGQQVSAGEQIGVVGNAGNSTGCHVHFGVYKDGASTAPGPFLQEHGVSV